MIILHFILSLIYVVLFTAFFVLFYFYMAKFIVWLFNFIRSIPGLLLHFLNGEFRELYQRAKATPTLQWKLKSSWVKRVTLFILVFNIAVYMQQLVYWNGKGSEYHSAKCYYAAGNVVATYRSFLAPVLTPNNILTFWLELPQRVIYNTAKPLIPKEDGEMAIWGYHWFVYPYAKRFTRPYGIYESKWNPLFRDRYAIQTYMWEFIKAVDKDNFKDQKMRDEHALRNLPLASLYLDELYNHENVPPTIFVTKEAEEAIAKKPIEYTSWQLQMMSGPNKEEGEYYKKRFDRLWMVNQKSFYICTTAYEGLKSLEQKWQESEFMRQEVEKHPSLEATRKAAMIAMLQGGALDFKFDKGDISCTDPDVLDYIKLRKELVTMKGINQLTSNLASRYIDHISAERMKYIFDTYCDYNLTGGFDTRFGTGPSRYAERPTVLRNGQILLKNKNTTKLGE
jgi:hypothetical protein